MDDFLEIDESKKTLKSLNLDDFSVEDLLKYITELEREIARVQADIINKNKLKSDAQQYFK
tara:strand:+ start:304 stop:486 length:183 start_codon:yes stop_codon:yes gene_type:complete